MLDFYRYIIVVCVLLIFAASQVFVGENGEVAEAETTEEIPEEAAAEADSQPQEIEEKENEEPEEAVEEEK